MRVRVKQFRIHNTMLQRWMNYDQREGIDGLKEKRWNRMKEDRAKIRSRGENKALGLEKGADATKRNIL